MGQPDTAMTPYGVGDLRQQDDLLRRQRGAPGRRRRQAAALPRRGGPAGGRAGGPGSTGREDPPPGAPERSVSFADVSMGVYGPDGRVVGGPVLGRGHYTPVDGTLLDPETGQGDKPAVFWMFAAQAAEVEVDEETGEVQILKLSAAHDVGRAINPNGCTGQVEGALGQGIGTALFEEMSLEDGRVLNPNLIDYKIPCTLDLPPLVPILVEEAHPEGPYGAKGVGEPGLAPTAAAIANAVYDALGVQIKTIPLTPERVLGALEGGADRASH